MHEAGYGKGTYIVGHEDEHEKEREEHGGVIQYCAERAGRERNRGPQSHSQYNECQSTH